MMGMSAKTGRNLPGPDHLRQSVADILTTPVGSRVMRRDYGSLIPELIDQPLTQANVLRLYAATAIALANWEPRIALTEVRFQAGKDGRATIEVQGISMQGQSEQIGVAL